MNGTRAMGVIRESSSEKFLGQQHDSGIMMMYFLKILFGEIVDSDLSAVKSSQSSGCVNRSGNPGKTITVY